MRRSGKVRLKIANERLRCSYNHNAQIILQKSGLTGNSLQISYYITKFDNSCRHFGSNTRVKSLAQMALLLRLCSIVYVDTPNILQLVDIPRNIGAIGVAGASKEDVSIPICK